MKGGKGTTTIGTSELAARLSISRQRVNELGRLGKITREPDGRWDPAKVAAALGRNLDGRQASPARERVVEMRTPDRAVAAPHKVGAGGGRKPKGEQTVGDDATPKKGTLLYEQWRHTQEKANREALERRKLEGELVESAAVESAWSEFGVKFRDAVMGLPSVVCNRLPEEWRREVSRVIDEEARKVLAALSDEIQSP
jgi:hypothetical protein